jgi:copper homeostasis protein (lipoprotein)
MRTSIDAISGTAPTVTGLAVLSLALLSVSGCVGIPTQAETPAAPPAASPAARMLAGAMLPALYEGTLPCADCAGIRYSLDIRADRVYFLRYTYIGKHGGVDESFDDIGVWSASPDANALILKGGRAAPLSFSIENPETLRKLDAEGRPIVSTLNYELRRNASYRPLEPRVSMRGMYSYMADAGIFRECVTQLKLPVAQLEDNAALESAYGRARKEPNEQLLVNLDGRIAMLPPTEGEGLQPTLVVERFIGVRPGEACESAASATLENTHWTLVRALGEPVDTPADRTEPHMSFDPIGTRVSGFSGCNRFNGGYERDGDHLTFKNVAMTMMACADSRNPEARFVQVMNGTTHWKIAGNELELLDPAGKSLATFRARVAP